MNEQSCLIKNTISCTNEEVKINNLLKTRNKNVLIVIYGKNNNDMSIFNKYQQMIKLGFNNTYLYVGGLFEWVCLQDIYGDEEFPTSTKELDILKFKPCKCNM